MVAVRDCLLRAGPCHLPRQGPGRCSCPIACPAPRSARPLPPHWIAMAGSRGPES